MGEETILKQNTAFSYAVISANHKKRGKVYYTISSDGNIVWIPNISEALFFDTVSDAIEHIISEVIYIPQIEIVNGEMIVTQPANFLNDINTMTITAECVAMNTEPLNIPEINNIQKKVHDTIAQLKDKSSSLTFIYNQLIDKG